MPKKNDLKDVIDFVEKNNSQAHLCICNSLLFDSTIDNGVYGFPHAGVNQIKSFWRAVASMYNIGPHDLIFLYRTKADVPGCQEISGPFKIYSENELPAIYYDLDSVDFPMKFEGKKGNVDCKVRLLFGSFDNKVFSINNNFELIKKFESKEIWGYRHPAVMNIGAARKKSITSFTYKQTLTILDLLKDFGTLRYELTKDIPTKKRIEFYNSLSESGTKKHFVLDDKFLCTADTNDEAFLYAYILRGLKVPKSVLHNDTINDFCSINDSMLKTSCRDFSVNAMMEAIISPHLQDELDIILFDKNDCNALFMEIKEGPIDQWAVNQTQNYIDLFETIFPKRNAFANIIGESKDTNIKIDNKFKDKMRLVSYTKNSKTGRLKFAAIKI